ncbi:MAG: helix-turn-helix domain-containing protein [Candidatus Actinomarina sp.]|tara:strand:+ start:269 stop:679 length:411 start_codon:yes stop_codon:yes gene_type:complete
MDKISENIDWQIAYWYIQGLSTTEIGKKVGMHRSTIYRRLQKNSVQAIINSFRNEMMQNLFAGMLGLGREIISNYHIKVKNNKVSPSEMNGFLRVLFQMSQKEVPIAFENPTLIAYMNNMKDFEIEPLKKIELEEE